MSGLYRRVSSLTSVVLPEPFSPTRARLSPGRRCRSMARSAGAPLSGIGEGNVLETDAVPRLRPFAEAAGRARHLLAQILVEVGQVEIVLVHAADGGETGRDRRLSLAKEEQVHRHLAEGDGAGDGGEGDPAVGAVKGGSGDEAEEKPPEIAAQGQPPVLGEEAAEDFVVAAEQLRAEAEELDFLGVVLAGKDRFEVHLHARIGRAPAEEAEFVAGILRLDQEFGETGEKEDEHRPGGELHQQDGVADQGDGVLHQAEGAVDQTQRAYRRLAAGAGELVVELRVLEVRQAAG